MFEDIIQDLQEFNANAWGYVAEAIEDNADQIVYINQSRIIDTGKDSEGKKLKNSQKSYSGYSPPYEKRKKRLGVYDGHINLFLSGEYLGSYDAKADAKEVDIFVTPNNADLDAILKTLYGENIQGLTKNEWAGVVNEFILPRIIEELTKVFT
jgi:hypothetical protein